MGTTYDQLIARNLRAARARADIDQRMLGARMQELGYTSWSGGKVSLAEQGKRYVYAAELLPLALSLECTFAQLAGAEVTDGEIETRKGYVVASVTVRNLSYGIPDLAVTWNGGVYPSIIRPATPYSAHAQDKTLY
jgi:hypothetical protein